MALSDNKISTTLFVPTLGNIVEMYGWQSAKSIQENMKTVCPWNRMQNIYNKQQHFLSFSNLLLNTTNIDLNRKSNTMHLIH